MSDSTAQGESKSRQESVSKSPWCQPVPHRPSGCCLQLAQPPLRPDLATYSQLEQISLGQPPSWNSPDITTNLDNPWKLLPAIQVVVRNLSSVASAINAVVTLSTSAFGIGMQQSGLSSQKLSLGPGGASTLAFPLTAALLGGSQSLGAYVVIENKYDSNPINNTGAQVAQGLYASQIGRNADVFFPVMNATGAPRTITLSVLSNLVGATVSPTSHNFAPWEQINALLKISIPTSLHGTPASPVQNEITVVGYAQDGSLVGGATWILWVDN